MAGITRLGWFNVNTKEDNLYYDGLPVTYSALIIPIIMTMAKVTGLNNPMIPYGSLLGLSFFYVLNVKIRKPRGIWYIIFPALAVITIIMIQLT